MFAACQILLFRPGRATVVLVQLDVNTHWPLGDVVVM